MAAAQAAHVIDCAVYVDGERLPGVWSHADAVAEVRKRRDGFVWIGLFEPDEEQIQGVADTFGLHELAVEDAVTAHQRPKLDRYEETLFMVLKTVRYIEHESPTTANEIVETGEIMAFLGKNFIVTVRHGKHSGLGAAARGAGVRARPAADRAGRRAARDRRPGGRLLPRRQRVLRERHRRDRGRACSRRAARSAPSRCT